MIFLRNLNKTFQTKGKTVTALSDVSLTINDGEIFGVIGYSGAGKSTLIRCVNLLESPDSGEISIDDQKIAWTDESGIFHTKTNHEMKKIRKGIGMIFQHFNLLDRSTVFDNIAYPLKFSGKSKKEIENRVTELLDLVDLKDKKDVYPSQLSGGQKQRVAIARALANNPKVLLSDEATSALDPDATASVLNLLKELNKKLGITIILITHEMNVIKSICQKVAVMEKGRIVEQGHIYHIFAEPKAPITQKFVQSQTSLSKIQSLIQNPDAVAEQETFHGGRLVKLQFQKDAVGDSLISTLSKKFDIDLNIVLANIDLIQGSPLGEIIVEMKGSDKTVEGVLDYIKGQNVRIFDYNANFAGWNEAEK